MVDTFSFRIYKSWMEVFLCLGYILPLGYVWYRFRVLEDMSVGVNALFSYAYMLSFFIIARFKFKLNMKRTLLIEGVAVSSIMVCDIITSVLIFYGFKSVDKPMMDYLSIYIQFSGGVIILASALLQDRARIMRAGFSTMKIEFLLVVIGSCMAYLVAVNFLDIGSRMSSESYHAVLAVFIVVLVIFLMMFIAYFKWKIRLIQVKERKKIIEDYVSILENKNQELRYYKHDIENIILGLREFIIKEDFDGLKSHFTEDVKRRSPTESAESKNIQALSPLKIQVLKGAVIRALQSYAKNGAQIIIESEVIEEQESTHMVFFALMVGDILRKILLYCEDRKIEMTFTQESVALKQRELIFHIRAKGISSIDAENELMIVTRKYRKYENLEVGIVDADDFICRASLQL
jgi:hypothetical protein